LQKERYWHHIEKGKISSEKEKDGGKVEGRQRKAERDSRRKGKDRQRKKFIKRGVIQHKNRE
jgi:hypothetical protein